MTDILRDYIRRGPQFTLLGDTNHDDPALRAYKLSEQFLATLRDAGVRHLFLEQPRNNQGTIEDIQNLIGNVSNREDLTQRIDNIVAEDKRMMPDYFKKNLTAEANYRQELQFFGAARLSGINVHYFDHDTDKDKQRTGEIAAGEKRDKCYQSFAEAHKPELERLNVAPEFVDARLSVATQLRERMLHDDSFAHLMREQSHGERSVAVIGNNHLTTPHGLPVHLGRDAQSLALFANTAQRTQYLEQMHTNELREDHTPAASQRGFLLANNQLVDVSPTDDRQITQPARRPITNQTCPTQ